MKRRDQMKLGTFIYTFGHNQSSWLHPGSDINGANSFAHMHKIASISEKAKFDFIFLADSAAAAVGHPEALKRLPNKMNRLEPLTLLSALAVTTDRIGLAATVSTSYTEPFNVARMFASLDHLSGGRACWNVVTSDHEETAYNFNRNGLDLHALRYERAREYVDVAFGLWDGWEPDALVLDREAGIYLDPAKVHPLDHEGKHFQVRGPLNIARSPQGRPVIAQAGGSEAGLELAAQTAEVVFTLSATFEKGRSFYENLKGRMEKYGRPRDSLKVMPGLMVNVGRTEAEAQAKIDYILDRMNPKVGLQALGEFLEADLSDLPLDQPLPREKLPMAPKGSKALFDSLIDFVSEGHTLGELIRLYAEKQTGNGIKGTPRQIADFMEEWFIGGAADGFMLMLPTLPASLQDFTELVVPELQRRGLFRHEYEGRTLRDHLGLTVPDSRHVAAAPAPAIPTAKCP